MNILGTIVFVILAGVSGLFLILAISSDVSYMTAQGSIMEGTTWTESESERRECAQMGYYYDEYGEEYEECDEYRYITMYSCSSKVNFNYTVEGDPSGELYLRFDNIGWAERESPCLSQIQETYAVNASVTVYYTEEAIDEGKLTPPVDPEAFYYCCAFCFGLLSIPALIFMLAPTSPGVKMKTGGFMGRFKPQRIQVNPSGPGGQIAPVVNYGAPVTQQGSQSNAGASQGGGMFGGGGMMMVPGMAGATAGYAAGSQQNWKQAPGYSGAPRVRSNNWKAPSRIRGYNRVMQIIGVPNNELKTSTQVRDAIIGSGMMDYSTASKFMENQHVKQVLGFTGAATGGAAAGGATSSMLSRNVPDPVDPNASIRPAVSSADRLKQMQEEAESFFESSKPVISKPTSRPVSSGESNQCAHPTCSVGVSAFDFRCFDCRQRFCSAHKGMTFQCDNCAN